ncbi:MAG: 4-(cytidine 5'-diphospho)-2-C-methyl-D-erythritol kinase [Clostridia bacterium]|nr:4-(cytidine 5'-diphospho)-2-C-methyl-D-erythritol kinase [Clostridia bacterium]
MTTVKAYAKVNLSLFITGIRNNGYHLLDTVMHSISLYDTVTVDKGLNENITVTCSNAQISGENNICHKAAVLFFNETKIKGGAKINIVKSIPLAAGLGGGSADAAAVLKGLNREFGCPLNEEALLKLALRLGADVPFCVKGGSARVMGIGEELIPFLNKLPLYMVLIKEDEKPSTAVMYKELDEKMQGIYAESTVPRLCSALENGDYDTFINCLYNDFSALWDFNSIRKALLLNGADGACLSGSGPMVMGFFRNKAAALKAYETLKDNYRSIYFAESVVNE